MSTLGEQAGENLATTATLVWLAGILSLPLLHGLNLILMEVAEVLGQVGLLYKAHTAQLTCKGSLTSVNLEVDIEGADLVVGCTAD